MRDPWMRLDEMPGKRSFRASLSAGPFTRWRIALIISRMIGRGIIASAVVVYLLVLVCAAWPDRSLSRAGEETPVSSEDTLPPRNPTARAGLPYRGVAMQIQRVDWIDQYKLSIDEIADLGADTVLLVVDTRQENGTSSRIYLDMRMTPTPEQLAQLIRHARDKGLRVIVMPVVLLDKPRGNEWRGTIKPESWDNWFDSYREMILHFAWICEGNGADVLVVGSELVSTENKLDEWTKTIRQVRKVFTGKLTYSANWDHYTGIPFWDQLDLIATNSYYKLGKDHTVGVEQIVRRWKDIQTDLLGFTTRMNKPLLFTEVGWCSMSNAAHQPWDYTTGDPIDLALQKKLYEGFFEAWHGNAALGGFIIWEWPPGEGGRKNRGYTPEGKPAEKVLREWLAKSPWDVR